jgi:FAD/FMN-containing dehydrogenase
MQAQAISTLREAMRGQLLVAGEDGYDRARRVWNATVDSTPEAIARCADSEDVRRALSFAIDHGRPIAVRGGGHSLPGFSTCDGGVVIDLSLMRGITVDPGSQSARAQGGVTVGEFDAATQEYGLATTFGVVSTTGIAGLTLGGGVGWLMRKHGLACDNLRSLEIATADGKLITASPDENPELFWGMKGGGGNFGVVTSFEFDLHAVGPIVFGGKVGYPPQSRRDLLHFYRGLTHDAPDELTTYLALTAGPDGSPLAALAACYAGPIEDGEKALATAHAAVGSPVVDALGPVSYVDQQRMLDAGFPPGEYHYWRSCFLDDLTDDVIDVLVERSLAVPAPPLLEIVVEHMGGAIRSGDGAFAHRAASYDVLIDANWVDPRDGERCIAWARQTAAALEPFARTGGYVNYEPDAGRPGAGPAYGQGYARLQALKGRYDPQNVFRRNQNIEPVS